MSAARCAERHDYGFFFAPFDELRAIESRIMESRRIESALIPIPLVVPVPAAPLAPAVGAIVPAVPLAPAVDESPAVTAPAALPPPTVDESLASFPFLQAPSAVEAASAAIPIQYFFMMFLTRDRCDQGSRREGKLRAVGILSGWRTEEWVKARVAGDAMDLALLSKLLMSGSDRGKTIASTAAVAGVTALDVVASVALSREPTAPDVPAHS